MLDADEMQRAREACELIMQRGFHRGRNLRDLLKAYRMCSASGWSAMDWPCIQRRPGSSRLRALRRRNVAVKVSRLSTSSALPSIGGEAGAVDG